MDQKKSRRDAVRAYKEREETGGLYRIVNAETGWQGAVQATPNLAGAQNRFRFGVATGACFDPSIQDQWAQSRPEAFSFVELERLTKKPEQSTADFREELEALLALYQGN